ncbi:hypothetical protein KA183_11345 [bacterium]|nr:hypothetical protein [bacterium]
MRRIFGILLSLISLAGMGLGFGILYNTEIRFLNSVPVETVVTDKRVEPLKDVNGQYIARATYRYHVSDDLYFGDKVLAYDFNTPVSEYVLAVIEPFTIGAPTVAYYNRLDPKDAFLSKSIPYPPYLAILSSLILFISGLYLLMTPGINNLHPKQHSADRYSFLPDDAFLFQVEKATLVQAIVFSVISVFTFGNYFIHVSKPNGIMEISAVCVFLLLASLLWKQAFDNKRRASSFKYLHLELESDILNFDKEYKAKINQKLLLDTKIVACDFAVIGHKSNFHGPVLSENWYRNSVDKYIAANEEFRFEQSFRIDSKSDGQAFGLRVCVQSATSVQEWNYPLQVNLSTRASEPR